MGNQKVPQLAGGLEDTTNVGFNPIPSNSRPGSPIPILILFNVKGALCNFFMGCKQTKKVLDARNSSLQELT